MQRSAWRSTVLIGALGLVLSGAVGAQTADPLVGTWSLNVAKSSYKPGPAPKSIVLVLEAAGAKGLKVTVDSVGPDGTALKWGYTSQRDGTDVAVAGNPIYDTANVVQTSPTTGTVTYKKSGKVVVTVKTEVSADGKTLTTTSDGTTADGQKMHNVAVYNRK